LRWIDLILRVTIVYNKFQRFPIDIERKDFAIFTENKRTNLFIRLKKTFGQPA